MTDIVAMLGREAGDRLNHSCAGMPKQSLHLR